MVTPERVEPVPHRFIGASAPKATFATGRDNFTFALEADA
jgi:hypothetical protein